MKILILLLSFIILNFTNLQAFAVEISGKVKDPKQTTIRIYSPQWFEDKIIQIDMSGNFKTVFESKFPAQYAVYYSEGKEETGYDFFVFDKEKITIDIDLASADNNNKMKLTGTSLRSKAFEKIDRLFMTKYMPLLRTQKNLDSIFNAYRSEIKSLENIGNDEFTEVAALSASLIYMRVLVTPEMKPVFNIFKREEFEKLPLYDEKFMGFSNYNQLMDLYKYQELKNSIKNTKDSTYTPTFTEMNSALEKDRKNISPTLYKSIKVTAFNNYKYALKDSAEKQLYLFELNKLIKENPAFHIIESMEKLYESIVSSLIGRSASAFTLKDSVGKSVSLHSMKGKYILMDVWGSWCGPCRKSNKDLVKLYDSLKSDPEIIFLSIAYDNDINAWKKAIADDKLIWMQLLYDADFIKNYQITAYPTMFLLSPDLKVLIRKTKITKEDLKQYLTQK